MTTKNNKCEHEPNNHLIPIHCKKCGVFMDFFMHSELQNKKSVSPQPRGEGWENRILDLIVDYANAAQTSKEKGMVVASVIISYIRSTISQAVQEKGEEDARTVESFIGILQKRSTLRKVASRIRGDKGK